MRWSSMLRASSIVGGNLLAGSSLPRPSFFPSALRAGMPPAPAPVGEEPSSPGGTTNSSLVCFELMQPMSAMLQRCSADREARRRTLGVPRRSLHDSRSSPPFATAAGTPTSPGGRRTGLGLPCTYDTLTRTRIWRLEGHSCIPAHTTIHSCHSSASRRCQCGGDLRLRLLLSAMRFRRPWTS